MTIKPTEQRLWAIASMKGGAGKSKGNLGLACYIAATQPDARVLLVDACQDQGYLSAMLAYEKNDQQHGLGQIIKMFRDKKPMQEIQAEYLHALTPVCVSVSQDKHLDFMPAAAETLGDLTLEGWQEKKRGELLHRFISELAMDYTHIIFDTVPLVRIPTTASVFGLADAIALILDVQEPGTLAGINGFVRSAKKYGAKLSGVISNMYDSRIAMSRSAKATVDLLCHEAGLKVLTVIPRSATMINSTTVYTTKNGLAATGMFVAGEFDKAQRHLFERLTVHFDQIHNGMEA